MFWSKILTTLADLYNLVGWLKMQICTSSCSSSSSSSSSSGGAVIVGHAAVWRQGISACTTVIRQAGSQDGCCLADNFFVGADVFMPDCHMPNYSQDGCCLADCLPACWYLQPYLAETEHHAELPHSRCIRACLWHMPTSTPRNHTATKILLMTLFCGVSQHEEGACNCAVTDLDYRL